LPTGRNRKHTSTKVISGILMEMFIKKYANTIIYDKNSIYQIFKSNTKKLKGA
jgi:hypothetical protein